MLHVALTFDVEQWDARARHREHQAVIAALGDIPSTWFVAEDRTQSFSATYPEITRELLAANHEVAAHVHFQRADLREMRDDVRAATEKLRAAGADCVSFRGGAHVFSDALAEELCNLGYRYDSSAVPGLVRRHHTHGGDTFAAWGHVWSARPYWFRPGLLELPTAAFPLTRPAAFAKKRFRLPLLVRSPEIFRARAHELARYYPGRDVPLVVLGHSFDLEKEGDTSLFARSLAALRTDPSIRFVTLGKLGQEIASGKLSAGLTERPSRLTEKLAHAVRRFYPRA